jgi:branched-chain amino acid transport system substrate-binding protein
MKSCLVVQGKENPKDKYDLMEIVKVVPREVTTYDPSIFGGELGPSDAKQC